MTKRTKKEEVAIVGPGAKTAVEHTVVQAATDSLSIAASRELPGLDHPWERLQAIKDEIIGLFRLDGALMIRIMTYIRQIEVEELFKYEGDDNGKQYTSMSAYLPALLRELQGRGVVHKLGVRQLRAWLAAFNVAEELGLSHEDVVEIGIGKVTELLEATDYNSRTGEIAVEPKPGKLGLAAAQEFAAKLKEDHEALPVKAVRETLDEARGVVRKWLRTKWNHSNRHDEPNGEVWLEGIVYFDGTKEWLVRSMGFNSTQVVPIATAYEIVRHMNAASNLDELAADLED